jgi:hypothetical protein
MLYIGGTRYPGFCRRSRHPLAMACPPDHSSGGERPLCSKRGCIERDRTKFADPKLWEIRGWGTWRRGVLMSMHVDDLFGLARSEDFPSIRVRWLSSTALPQCIHPNIAPFVASSRRIYVPGSRVSLECAMTHSSALLQNGAGDVFCRRRTR